MKEAQDDPDLAELPVDEKKAEQKRKENRRKKEQWKKRRDEEFQLQLERYAQLGLNPHLQHSPAAVALAMQAHQQAQGFVHPPGPQTGHYPAHFPPYPTAPPVTLVAEVDGANAAAWANEAGASGAGASEAGASEAATSGGKRGGGGS